MKKPILVTGAHKSGTTWTGKAIALSKRVAYLHEPFNINPTPGVGLLNFDLWFKYIDDNVDNNDVKMKLERILNFRFSLLSEIRTVNTLKSFYNFIKSWVKFTVIKLGRNKRTLMKDPIAVMSAEWLHQTFDMDVVVLIRHPASFVSSIKRYGLSHPFRHFLRQPRLMENKLSYFEKEIKEFSESTKSLVDQGILLWRIIYRVVQQYRKRNEGWIFIRQEDLSSDPLVQFGNIYDNLDLDYTESIQNKITEMTSADNPEEVEKSEAGKIKRNSGSQVKIFKKRLDKREIEYIKEKSRDVWKFFYDETYW